MSSISIPRPTIPLKPVLSFASLGSAHETHPSLLDLRSVWLLTSGRSAIALALKELGVTAEHEVLIPAYHCTSMVDPAVWLGAEPVFFRVTLQARVDMDDLAKKVTSKTRALLITHYFGFPQDSARIRAFCDERGIGLIEDCAHAFFGFKDGQPIGGFGDYAIASSMKFFPIYDGGVLASNRHDLSHIRVTSAGIGFDVKAFLNGLEYSLEYGRLAFARPLIRWPLAAKDALWRAIKRHRGSARTETIGPAAADGAYGFDAHWVDKRQSLMSQVIMHWTDARRLVKRRRSNYLRMHEALRDIKGGAPLYTELPEGVVPYVYPFLMDAPDKVFMRMKMAGIPILRFGEFLWSSMDDTVCPATMELSRRVFQFPCHQELAPRELEWMIDQIKTILQSS